MGTVITNLKARFGVDSADFKKGLKDGEKAVDDFKDGAGSALDKFASMFGLNMSAVTDALGTATKSLNFLGQSITGLATGANKAAVAFKLMKTVLISTGIGALVVALGSLVAYFQKSGEGADKFAKILAQVKSVVNNVIDRLAIFGKGIFEIATGKFKQGWETMRGAFKDIGTEIKEDWKASGQLADAWDALEERERDLNVTISERKAKAEELRLLAKEETEDQKKKLSLVQQAESLLKSAFADEVKLAKDRYELTKRQIALQSSDPTDEQLKEIRDLETAVNDKIAEQSKALRGMIRERATALAFVKEEAALEEAKAKNLGITKATIDNIKIPNLAADLSNQLAPMTELYKTTLPAIGEALSKLPGIMSIVGVSFQSFATQAKAVTVDISDALNSTFEGMAVNIGEFFGALATGDANAADFGKMIISTFADMAIQVGKIVISAALAVAGIDKALKIPGAWPVALAAGIALVAIGSAVKGALSSAAGGGGGSATSATAAGGSYTYNTNMGATAQPMTIRLEGEFVQRGSDLVAVINNENTRKYKNT